MEEMTLDERLSSARQTRQEFNQSDVILIGIIITLILLLIGFNMFENDGWLNEYDYLTNAFTEGISILFTVLIINRLGKRRADQQLKQRLVREAGSRAQNTALSAVDWIRHEGLLEGEKGLLKGANLSDADLRGAIFGNANLEKADLVNANLEGVNFLGTNLKTARLLSANLAEANLLGANLERAEMLGTNLAGANLVQASLNWVDLRGSSLKKAILNGANLEKANLSGANLEEANLREVNMEGANLYHANLIGAGLRGANLKGANLSHVTFDEKTLLPDAKYQGMDESWQPIYDKYWTPDTDMTRYTDPNHPDFWQPDWVKNQGGEG
jgi:uncharacterized protein YjbI with pentapeptide repeats